MDDIPWKMIMAVGGAVVGLAIVAAITAWAVPYLQSVLP